MGQRSERSEHGSGLYRATHELFVEGRTLVGVALPWDRVARVRDLTGPAYLEAFNRNSADVTLRQNPEPRPLWNKHAYAFDPTADPLGVVAFTRTEPSLDFVAHLSRTREADEQLELVRDGAKKAVSVGFEPLQGRKVRTPEGLVTYRTEIKLNELSLAPTGRGQYPEAKVLAMRAQRADTSTTFDDIREAVSDAVEEMLFGVNKAPDGVYVYLPAIGEGWAVYCVEGGPEDHPELNDTWRVEYAFDSDGVCTVSKPVRVEQQWSEVVAARSLTPRLDAFRRSVGRSTEVDPA